MKMRRGESGTTTEENDLYKKMARFILACSAQDAPYLLNSVSIKGWKPATAIKRSVKFESKDGNAIAITGADWADEAAALSKQGTLLYDKQSLMGDLPGTLEQMLARETVAIISGHDELTRIWEKDHDEWLKRKSEWESKNQQYLALRPRFDAFEIEAGGAATKRRERWHKYLDWLGSNPDLAGWRGGDPLVHPLSPQALKRIEKAKPSKRASLEAKEFWNANPELKELDKMHGYYEREFVRRRKTKRNPDGFDHRPTFTLPHALKHPRWLVFNAPQTSPQGYRQLLLPETHTAMGQIQLRLLTAEPSNGIYPNDWVPIRFKADPRLSDFKPCKVQKAATKGMIKGELQERNAYIFTDRQLRAERKAQISGAKLIFRFTPDGAVKASYLVFTCNIDDEPWTLKAKDLKWTESGELGRKGNKRKKIVVPNGLVACAVDLGVRNLGFGTIAAFSGGAPSILRSRNIWIAEEEQKGRHPGRWSAGPDLAHIARHKREIRALRQLRGKPVRGENSHIELQDHITHLAEDRFKKGARAIIDFALNTANEKSSKTHDPYPRADVLVLENLASLIPDAEKERGINRALVNFNRGHMVERLKQMAKDYGLRVHEVSPVGTSQVCSKCGQLGRRYSLRHLAEENCLDIAFGWVEKLFACSCGYRANSDHNASVNLQRRFSMGEAAVQSFRAYQDKSDRAKAEAIQAIESELRPALRKLHKIGPPERDSDWEPF
jgi:IS605 OrfB family transposase